MQEDQEILESLIVGGVIGAALGALVTNRKGSASLGAIAGAVILASFRANENAKKTNIPLLVEQGRRLYRIQPDGTRQFIKSIPGNPRKLPKKFTLK